jgi:hypothetical protein
VLVGRWSARSERERERELGEGWCRCGPVVWGGARSVLLGPRERERELGEEWFRSVGQSSRWEVGGRWSERVRFGKWGKILDNDCLKVSCLAFSLRTRVCPSSSLAFYFIYIYIFLFLFSF